MQWPIIAIILTQVLLPLYLIWMPWSRAAADKLDWSLTVFYGAAYLCFIYVIGQWSWLGMIPRYALPILFIASAVAAWRRQRHKSWRVEGKRSRHVLHLFHVGFGVFFLALAGLALSGRYAEEQAVDLQFPLQDDRYVVAHGGDHYLINYHNSHEAQRYALDLLALNIYGMRAHGLLPDRVDAYAIQNALVTSPCTGRVLAVADGRADNTPPASDPAHAAGNHVIVGCQDVQVLLAHFTPNSIRVSVNQEIAVGTLLGRVGNSGNSSEPHLHIHAVRMTQEDGQSKAVGVPIRFDGRFLIRNDVIAR